ncbi:MAG: D-2-hydroxyacid dehydrogenase [Acidobacteria bacterium]|nr:D-2-hydroxyacid dehydrogenase [Acidobacteriota bacterium]
MNSTLSRRVFLGATGTAAVPGAFSSTTALLAATPVVVATYPLSPPRPDTSGPVKIVAGPGAPLTPAEAEQIRSAGKNVELHTCRTEEEFREKAADAEVLLGYVSREVLASAKNVKWIQAWAAGVEDLPEETFEHPAVLTNMARVFTPVIAETALAMLLGLTRGLVTTFVPNMREHRWRGGSRTPLTDLYGKTMGIVGMGGMGSEIARRAYYGFGMKVLATDAKPLPKPEFVAELREPEWLMEMVPQVDVLVSAAPHTKTTDKMFNAGVFERMKPTAYFINTSRGGLVDQPALARALVKGRIRGAGLDVTTPEPLPPGDPLWDAPNLVITGHSSGAAPIRQVRLIGMAAENVRRYSHGLPLMNVVDKVRRY